MKKCDCWIKTQDNLVNVQTVTDAIILKGFSPYVGPNGNWFEYDEQLQQYIDTGVHAKGDRGEKGEKGDTYTITEADYIAIGDLVTEREESKFNQYVEGKKEEFNSNATTKTGEFNANAQSKTSTFDANAVSKTNAFNTNASVKTSEFDTHATQKADEEIARINADEIVARIDEKADKSDTYTKTEVDEKVAQATPTDYEEVKEDIALLKWKTLNLATEVVDSQEAYSKSVPSNVYENALLNKIGGKTEVANQLLQFNNKVYTQGGIETKIENGIITIQGIATTSGGRNTNFLDSTFTFVKNHIYMIYGFYANVEIIFYFENSSYSIVESFSLTPTSKDRIFTYSGENVVCSHLGFNKTEGTQYNASGRIKLVDLTKRFGAGNEPTSTDDIRIKLLDQELEANGDYNEGSLVNAEVQNIVSRGANLWDGTMPNVGAYQVSDILRTKTYLNASITDKDTSVDISGIYLGIADTTTYPFHEYSWLIINGDIVNRVLSRANVNYLALYPNNEATLNKIKQRFNIMVSSTTNEISVLPYTPYFENVKPIASIISKYFPNQMKSAGSVYDEFDLEKGKAIQRVDSVDLGTPNWVYRTSDSTFEAYIDNMTTTRGSDFICPLYSNSGIAGVAVMENMSGQIFNDTRFYVKNETYTNVSSFKNAMAGVELYYPLATPIVTDIDKEDLEYLEALKVESNGTITFEQLSTYIQIPNEESYLKRVE